MSKIKVQGILFGGLSIYSQSIEQHNHTLNKHLGRRRYQNTMQNVINGINRSNIPAQLLPNYSVIKKTVVPLLQKLVYFGDKNEDEYENTINGFFDILYESFKHLGTNKRPRSFKPLGTNKRPRS